jgi:putative ABC transport system permease protein
MYRLALMMLFRDHAKYLMLLSGVTFATLLIAQGSALFCGLMSWTFSSLKNMRAEVWVADPKVEQVNDNKPLRDTDVDRIRSVDGVAWASPLYQANSQARLANGSSKLVTLVGLDPTTLAGAPRQLVEGDLDDLRRPNTVIIDEFGVERLSEGLGRKIRLGDIFEINDREARVVGVCKAVRSFTGGPYVFTTYDRAIGLYSPPQRKLLSFVLAAPAPGASPDEVAGRIREETGLRAYTENQFMWATVFWYVRNTGIPINVGLIVLIGFVVGMVITAQTFYSFVHENTRHLAALKAMGTSTFTLCKMLVVQSVSVALIGFGIGIGVVTLLGLQLLRLGKVPFLFLWQIPAGVLCAVLCFSLLAIIVGVIRIAWLETALVFRA